MLHSIVLASTSNSLPTSPCCLQCANGAMYCQLFDLVKPGILNMQKVSKGPVVDQLAAQSNYRQLEVALEKVGSSQPLDSGSLSKANPMASLELLHRLYALSGAASAATPKGLKDLDPNSLSDVDSGRRGGGKRKAAIPPSGGYDSSKRISKAESCASVASTAADGSASTSTQEPTELTKVEGVLKKQLEEVRAELSQSRVAQQSLEEEVGFYVKKLESIEDACQACPTNPLAGTVLGLLHADEAELAEMAPVA